MKIHVKESYLTIPTFVVDLPIDVVISFGNPAHCIFVQIVQREKGLNLWLILTLKANQKFFERCGRNYANGSNPFNVMKSTNAYQ